MKLLVASDIHGSEYFCQKLLEAYDREQADRMLLLGDILYHGPRNDLPQAYAPKAVIAMLNTRSQDILCIQGNCDGDVDQMVLEFPIMAKYGVFFIGKRLVYATHGHQYNITTPPPLQPGDILLYGHTHIPAWEPFGKNNLYLNPGSTSIPKNGSQPSYMMIDGSDIYWKNLDGVIYHTLSIAE